MLKKLMSFLLVCGLALSGQPARAADTRPVVVGQGFLADSLDPANAAAGWAWQAHGVAETLFTVDRQGRAVPNLAESVRREGDGRWRLSLKPGLRFADGTPLDAGAVKAAFERTIAANPRARAQTGALGMEVASATDLLLAPERAIAAMEPVLAEFPLVIYRVDGDRFVFTGPYQVVEYRRGELVRLAPNPHYRIVVERPPVTIRRLTDPQALALGLESGELDIAFNLAAETLPRLKRRSGLTIKGTPVAYQYMLLANTAKAPLDDPRVRQAIDLAIDRRDLVTVLGAGEIASGLYPRFMPWSLETPRAVDVVAAEALLDAAGWRRASPGAVRQRDGQALEITLTNYPQRADFLSLTPVVRAQLEAIGMRVRAETVDNITPHLMQKRFDLAFWTMHTAPGGDGAFALEQYLASGAPLNVMGYANARMDGVIDRLRATVDPTARNELVREATRLVLADAPMIFLMTPVWQIGLSERVSGYEPYPSDYYIVRSDLLLKP
jgi:peptide/nickel transport system substrate-binding protein